MPAGASADAGEQEMAREAPPAATCTAAFARAAAARARAAALEAKALAVVVLPGSFNPPHQDHVYCLELAKQELERTGEASVVAGLLQPSSDAYVRSKLGPLAAMRLTDRVRACELAAGGRGWLGVWRGGEVSGHRATLSAAKFVASFCAADVQDRVTPFLVCGADFVERLGGWQATRRPPVYVVVARPGAVLPTSGPPLGWRLARAPGLGEEGRPMSSTRARALIAAGAWDELSAPEALGEAVSGLCRTLHNAGALYFEPLPHAAPSAGSAARCTCPGRASPPPQGAQGAAAEAECRCATF